MRSLKCLHGIAMLVLASVPSVVSAQFSSGTLAPPSPMLPVPQLAPDLPPPAVVPLQPMTVSEFVASFKPLPGKYEVLLIHPKTGCPVRVCFTLPPGCLRGVRCTGHKIVFDYKCQCDVVIRFMCCGKVWVRG